MRRSGDWRGIRYGGRHLKRKQMDEGRDLYEVPLVYADAHVTEGQKVILVLPSKLCTYEAVHYGEVSVFLPIFTENINFLHCKGKNPKTSCFP